jgi:hypothetical protein
MGESRISIESEEVSGNFFASILYKKSDSLLINVSGPFGLNVGKIFIGKKRFIFLNNMANQFYTGTVTDFKDQKFLQFPVKITELSDFFVGKDLINNMKIIKYSVENDLFFIQGQNNSNIYNLWIDNNFGQIKKIEYLHDNTVILVKEYDKITKIGDLYFPKFIKLTRPNEKQSISIFYNRLKINQEISPSQFAVEISDTARQINLDLEEIEEKL